MMLDLESLGSIPLAAAGAALLVAAAWALAGIFVRPPSGKADRITGSASLQVAVGLNLVAWIGMILGQCGLLAGGRPLCLLIVCAALGVPRAVWWWRERRGGAFSRVARPWRRASFKTALAWTFAAITLGPALCPPTGWDELVYHHELPRRWLAAGRPAFYPDLAYSGFPSLGETLFWLVAPLEGVIAPRLIIWVCWIVGLRLIYQMLRRRLAGTAPLTLTLAFAASSAVLMISANCYVESILLMNVAALLSAISTPRRKPGAGPERAPAMFCGVLAGGAAAVKLTGLAVLVIPCMWYAAEVWRDRARLPAASRRLATYLLVAAGVCLPFYLRTWLATGNPFYPYFCGWFTDDPAQVEMSRFHHALGDAFGLRTVVGLAASPVLLAYREDLYDGTFGWQLLLFAALSILAVVAYGRNRRLRAALWPAPIFAWLFGFWFLSAQQGRFAVPAIIPLILLSGLGLQRLRGALRRGALGLLIAAALVSAPWRTAGHYVGSWFTAVGLVSRIDYLNVETDGYYVPLLAPLREHTPADAKLMLLFEHRGFYLPRAYTTGTPLFQETGLTPPKRFATATEVLALLARDQITHIVVTKQLAGPERAPGLEEQFKSCSRIIEQCAAKGRLRLLWESEKYRLYEVR